MGIQVIIGGVSMLSMIYSLCIYETCVVLIFCLIAMWCGNSYMLSSKVGKSIYKGFNASGLCVSIQRSLYLSSLNIGAEGVGVIFSGRLSGDLMIRCQLTSNGLCLRRCGNILDFGYLSFSSIIGLACIKVGLVW
jgi:hypothetical protein